ncbi:MAG TPA: phosphatidylglycerophosphatase A [Halanaerobiales bacterium]|nr:phosphatidylglycerophosphatase A [Halanaerobiales bacterium]
MNEIKKKITEIIASCFYIGYIPGAPGTYGSLFALLLISQFNFLTKNISVVIFIIFGLIFSTLMEKQTGKKDDQRIVIDEFVGMLITFYFVKPNFAYLIIGFILFRLYDIYKPYPIKKIQNLPSGWGIMLDDILAGVYARIVLHIFVILQIGF